MGDLFVHIIVILLLFFSKALYADGNTQSQSNIAIPPYTSITSEEILAQKTTDSNQSLFNSSIATKPATSIASQNILAEKLVNNKPQKKQQQEQGCISSNSIDLAGEDISSVTHHRPSCVKKKLIKNSPVSSSSRADAQKAIRNFVTARSSSPSPSE